MFTGVGEQERQRRMLASPRRQSHSIEMQSTPESGLCEESIKRIELSGELKTLDWLTSDSMRIRTVAMLDDTPDSRCIQRTPSSTCDVSG